MESLQKYQTAPINVVIELVTHNKTPDDHDFTALHFLICDRIRDSRQECGEAIKAIANILMIDNSVRVYQCAKLLETLSKNSSLLFHIMNSRKALSPVYLQAVHRSRPGKLTIKNKIEQKSVKARWEKSDTLLLGLIQLWADTFMMQEDKYPGYQVTFRQLAKEHAKFPMRDANMRMFMEQFCKDSPMFEYVEQIAGRSVPKKPVEVKVVQNTSFDFDSEVDTKNAKIYKLSDLPAIQNSLEILQQIRLTAGSIEELKSQVCKDIYTDTQVMNSQLKFNIKELQQVLEEENITELKFNKASELAAYLMSMVDYIESEHFLFKQAYHQFKNVSTEQQLPASDKVEPAEPQDAAPKQPKKLIAPPKASRVVMKNFENLEDLLDLGAPKQAPFEQGKTTNIDDLLDLGKPMDAKLSQNPFENEDFFGSPL